MRVLLYIKNKKHKEHLDEKMRVYRNYITCAKLNGINYVTNLRHSFDIAHFLSLDDKKEILKVIKMKKKVIVSCFNSIKETNLILNNGVFLKEVVNLLNKVDVVLVPTIASKLFLKNNGVITSVEILTQGINSERFNNMDDVEKNAFIEYAGIMEKSKIILGMCNYSKVDDVNFYYQMSVRFPNYQFYLIGTKMSKFVIPYGAKEMLKMKPKNLHYKYILDEDLYKSAMINTSAFLLPPECSTVEETILEAMILKKQIIGFKNILLDDIILNNRLALLGRTIEEVGDIFEGYQNQTIDSTVDQAYSYALKQNYETIADFLKKTYEMLSFQ